MMHTSHVRCADVYYIRPSRRFGLRAPPTDGDDNGKNRGLIYLFIYIAREREREACMERRKKHMKVELWSV